MSDSSPSAPNPAATTSAASADVAGKSTKAPEKKAVKGRWRRRLVRALVIVIVLAGMFRAVVYFALGPVLRKVGDGYGMNVTFDRQEFTFIAGDVGLWGLKAVPKDGLEPVVYFDYVRGYLSVYELLRGKLHVLRAEADGVDVLLERTKDGRLPLLAALTSAQPGAAPPPPPPSAASPPADAALNFTSPIGLEAFRVSHIRAKIRDAYVDPPTEAVVAMDVRLSDVGLKDKATRFEADIWSDPVLESLRVTCEGTGGGRNLQATAKVTLRGFHLKPLAAYLESLGIKPTGSRLDGNLTISLKTEPLPDPSRSLKGWFTIEGVNLTSDLQPVASLSKVHLIAPDVDATAATIGPVLVEDGVVHATRAANGLLQVAGFELAGTGSPDAKPAPQQPPPAATPTPPIASASPAATQPSRYRLAVTEVVLRDLAASLSDQAVSPTNELKVVLNELTLKSNGTGAGLFQDRMPVEGKVTVPGVVNDIRFRGTVQPFTPEKALELALTAEGVKPDALRPYLAAAGIESSLQNGRMEAKLTAKLRAPPQTLADLHLSDVRFVDSGGELLALDRAEILGVGADPRTGRLKIASADLSGPTLDVARQSDGRLRIGGMQVGGTKATAAVAPAPQPLTVEPPAHDPSLALASVDDAIALPGAAPGPTTSAATRPSFLPRLEVGRFTWKDAKLHLYDEFVQPPALIAFNDFGIEAKDLVLDVASTEPSTDGAVRIWLKSSQVVRELTVDGHVRSESGAVKADLDVKGSGLNLLPLAGYFRYKALDPTIRDGTLKLKLKTTLAEPAAGTFVASADIADLLVSDADKELAKIGEANLHDIKVAPGILDAGLVRIVGLRAEVARERDGIIYAVGMRPAPGPTQGSAAPAEPPAGPSAPSPSQPATQPASGAAAAPVKAVFRTNVFGKVIIEDARIEWTDRAAPKPVRAVVHADAEATGLTLKKAGPPAKVRAKIKVDESVEQLTIDGEVSASPGAPMAKVKIDARGVRAGPMSGYLPPQIELSTTAGHFKAAIDAGVEPNPQGGNSVRAVIEGLDWREGDSAEPLLSIDSLKALASRIDPTGNTITIEEVSLTGFQTDAQLDADGSKRAAGVIIRPSSEPPPPPAAASAEAQLASAAQPASSQPTSPEAGPTTAATGVAVADGVKGATPAAPTTSPSASSGDVDRLVAEARRPLPLITIDKIDLNVRRATLRNFTDASSVPLTLENLRLHNLARIEMGGPRPDSLPHARLELTAKVSPVVDKIVLGVGALPLAPEPSGSISLNVSGIRGQGLIDFMPKLREKIDPSQLTDGRFTMAAQAKAKLSKRGPRDFDLSRGFTLDASIDGIAFSQGDTVFAGFESIRADQVRVEPKAGNVFAKALEITKPQARAYRDTDGIHALGVVILMPEKPATQPTTDESATPTAPPPPAENATVASASTPEPKARPKGEIRVDRFTIDGLDVRVEDRSFSPHLIVPLNNMDLEVRGFTTLALVEPRPIRFSLLLNADKVPLKVVSKGKESTGESPTTQQFEDRELFSQVALTGQMTLYPKPIGYLKTSINGVELAAFEGVAKEADVELTEGTFDGTVDARFRQNGDLDTRSKFVLTDLQLSEPEDGWIKRQMPLLPAPLDTVIVVLRDEDGSITIRLPVTVEQGKVSGSEITAAAISAFYPIVGAAVASSGVKIVGGVGDALGLGDGDKDRSDESQPVVIQFPPGSTDPQTGDVNRLNELLERARKDKDMQLTVRHELGGADVDVAARRANPSREDCLAMASELHVRKLALGEERARLAGEARAQLALQPASDSEMKIAKVRALDRKIADVELSLDQLYDLLKPGAERQAVRRTRAACIEIGRARCDAIARVLRPADLPDAAERVRVGGAQFNPSDSNEGGRIVVTPLIKKHAG